MRTTRFIPLLSILLLLSSTVAGRAGEQARQDAPGPESKKTLPTLKDGRYLFNLAWSEDTGDEKRQIVRIEKIGDAFSVKTLKHPLALDGNEAAGDDLVQNRWGLDDSQNELPDFDLKIDRNGHLSVEAACPAGWMRKVGVDQRAHTLEIVGKANAATEAAGTFIARTADGSFLATGQWKLKSIEAELAEIEADPKAIVRRQNTAAAIQMLRNINSIQAVFESGIGEGQFTNDLRRLGGGERSDEVGLLNVTVVQAQYLPKRGYLLGPITCRIKTPTTSAGYFITCYPVMASGDDRTGDDCFYVDETGVIRHSGAPDVPAGPDSPPIGN